MQGRLLASDDTCDLAEPCNWEMHRGDCQLHCKVWRLWGLPEVGSSRQWTTFAIMQAFLPRLCACACTHRRGKHGEDCEAAQPAVACV